MRDAAGNAAGTERWRLCKTEWKTEQGIRSTPAHSGAHLGHAAQLAATKAAKAVGHLFHGAPKEALLAAAERVGSR